MSSAKRNAPHISCITEKAAMCECVVLLHGVGMSALSMKRLESRLLKDGYRVANISYPSRTASFDEIAGKFLPKEFRKHDVASAPRVHFVTHSMGSLVLRLLCSGENRPVNLGRVVMLGPPNRGSAAADRAAKSAVMRALIGKNLPALGVGEAAITRTLGPADFEVGVIAGSSKINPLFRNVLADQNDGAVPLESTKLDGMSDFIVMPHSHTVMLWRNAVIDQVVAFLKDGKFRR